jgi:hypothetical protein
MRKLDFGTALRNAPNSHSRFNSELLPGTLQEPALSKTLLAFVTPSSRTLVTKFSNFRCYRFYSPSSPNFAYAPPAGQNPFLPSPCLEIARAGDSLPSVLFFALCGHFSVAAQYSCRPLLLPLHRIAYSGRMRKNVRVQTQRLPLVGHSLRETSYEAPS